MENRRVAMPTGPASIIYKETIVFSSQTSIRAFVNDISILMPINNRDHHDDKLDGCVFQDHDTRLTTYIKVIIYFCAEFGMKVNYEKNTAVSFDWSHNQVHYSPGSIVFPHGEII